MILKDTLLFIVESLEGKVKSQIFCEFNLNFVVLMYVGLIC